MGRTPHKRLLDGDTPEDAELIETAAAYYCDHLYVLDHGRLASGGPPVEILTSRLLAEVYGVTSEVAIHPRTGAPQVTCRRRGPTEGR